MKLTEIRPLKKNGTRPDRLTQLLIWAAVILVAALAAIAADLWMWPPPGTLLPEKVGAERPVLNSVSSLQVKPPVGMLVAEMAGAILPSTSETSVLKPILSSSCIPPDGWIVYIVQDGNTLRSVAERHGSDVKTLMQMNCLNTAAISVDQRLYVPVPQAVPALGTPTAPAPAAVLLSNTPLPSASVAPMSEVPTAVTVTSALGAKVATTPTFTSSLPLTRTSTPQASASATPTSTRSTVTPQTPMPAQTEVTPQVLAGAPGVPVTLLPTPPSTATPETAFQVNIPNRYLNIILLGSDRRPGWRTWRTDSMIVVSVDMENNVVRLLSIPRDLWVHIPGHGYNRVNTAELWGELAVRGSGTERVKQTIHHNLGIPIHYYVRVDFQGFTKIIDAVGGLDIDVDCPLPDIDLKSGMHHMDGQQSLRYARSRKSTNDFDRGRRQRKVLLALWDQALSMDIIPKLPDLWVTMDDAFETDLPLDQVIGLAYVGVRLKPQHIVSRAIGRSHVRGWRTPQGAAVLLPQEDRLRAMLESFYWPIDPAALDATDGMRVQVLNGWRHYQADKLAASALRWEGFEVTSTGQAERQDHAQTQILVYKGRLTVGERIAQQLVVPLTAVQDLTGLQEGPSSASAADIRVLLGRDYNPCKR